jgi:MYXO-CTERM domain-containing protein
VKISSVYKFVGVGAIATTLAVFPLTISAQAQTQNNAPDTYSQQTGDVSAADTDNDFDWGWLGLLGLAGLAGLAGKKRRETVHHTSNDPNVRVH